MTNEQNHDSNFVDKYERWLRELKSDILNSCPNIEDLMQYFDKKLTSEEQQMLKEHLDLCPTCLEAWQHLQAAQHVDEDAVELPENWSEIEKSMDERVYAHLKSKNGVVTSQAASAPKTRSLFDRIKSWLESVLDENLLKPRLAYVAILLCVGVGALYAYAFLARPDYYSIALMQAEQTGFLRGADVQSESLRRGLQYFDQKNYTAARKELNGFLEKQPNHYQANFVAGVSCLFEAKKQLLGLSYQFDEGKVKLGMSYLEKALSLADRNSFYQEDCFWYLGKAYIMAGDLLTAKNYFTKIVQLTQPNLNRKDDALRMVQRMTEFASKE